jgi:spore coat protein H
MHWNESARQEKPHRPTGGGAAFAKRWPSHVTRLFGVILVAWGATHLAAVSPPDSANGQVNKLSNHRESPGSDVFGLNRVQPIHLELSAKEWQAMQTTEGSPFAGFFGGPPRPRPSGQKQPAEDRDIHRTGGTEFPWAHANLMVGAETYTNIGLRYKGNFTYMISRGSLKRSLKVELDHYDKAAPRFHGLRKFNLHTGVTDPARVREALCYAIFRAAGVAAPRTAFAEVTLSVPRRYNREYVGLYTLTEQVDKLFLDDRFGNGQGLLMKPRVRGPDYLGESWDRYQDRYQPQREPTAEEARRVIEFAHLVNLADDRQFSQEIAAYLDVEAFLRFLAVNAFVVNLDSPLAMPQNYYIYLNPQTRKFVFLPWDLDLGLAAWPFGGSADQQMNLSLMHPHVGKHKLIDRLLAMPDVKARYSELLKELAASCFSKEALLKQIETIEQATKGPLAKEAEAVASRKENAGGFGQMFGGMRAPDPRTFVIKRTESVQAQLAGKSSGYVPVSPMSPQ